MKELTEAIKALTIEIMGLANQIEVLTELIEEGLEEEGTDRELVEIPATGGDLLGSLSSERMLEYADRQRIGAGVSGAVGGVVK